MKIAKLQMQGIKLDTHSKLVSLFYECKTLCFVSVSEMSGLGDHVGCTCLLGRYGIYLYHHENFKENPGHFKVTHPFWGSQI